MVMPTDKRKRRESRGDLSKSDVNPSPANKRRKSTGDLLESDLTQQPEITESSPQSPDEEHSSESSNLQEGGSKKPPHRRSNLQENPSGRSSELGPPSGKKRTRSLSQDSPNPIGRDLGASATQTKQNPEESKKKLFSKYDYAFIGAGATTAYYIEENKEQLKGKKILVVGPDQPWAGERGPGRINHPMHQIVPNRPPKAGDGLADRTGYGSFSEWVEGVLSSSKDITIDRHKDRMNTNTRPTKTEDYYYQITLENENDPVKAKNVILAPGIGPHSKPQGITAEYMGLPQDNSELKFPRVLSLDEFQQALGDKDSGILKKIFQDHQKNKNEKPTVILAGPNAGIDAVTSYARELQHLVKFKWITGRGLDSIPFLEGTDNAKGKEVAQKKSQKESDDFESDDFELEKGRFDNVSIAEKGDKVIAKAGDKELEGDLFIYALGPERGFLDNFLPAQTTAKENLEPIYDRSNRIMSAYDEFDSANELDKQNVEKRIKDWLKSEYHDLIGGKDEDFQKKEVNSLREKEKSDKIQAIVEKYNEYFKQAEAPKGTEKPKAPDFGRKSRPKDSMESSVVGFKVRKENKNDPNFLVLGGSANRLADQVDYKYHSDSINNVIESAKSPSMKAAWDVLAAANQLESKASVVFANLLSQREIQDPEKKTQAQSKLGFYQDTLKGNLKKLKEKLSEQEKPSEQEKLSEQEKPSQSNEKIQLSSIERYVQSLLSSIENFDGRNNPLKSATHMTEISTTLPINVALGDQLTSVLSQVNVASEQQLSRQENKESPKPEYNMRSQKYRDSQEYKGKIQEYTKRQNSFSGQRNLLIDDTTNIAKYIAAEYPYIPPVMANGISRQIVKERRYSPNAINAVPSYDIDEDRADTTSQFDFQEKWKHKLQELNDLGKGLLL